MRIAALLIALLTFESPFSAQHIRPAGQHQADKAAAQFDKSIPGPERQPQNVNLEKLKQDANELADLAQSIPPAVDETTKGLLPKDLNRKILANRETRQTVAITNRSLKTRAETRSNEKSTFVRMRDASPSDSPR